MTPSSAEAAATAGEQRYTDARGFPMRPLKFLFVVESAVSLSPGPLVDPRHGPHPGFITTAPEAIEIRDEAFPERFRIHPAGSRKASIGVPGATSFRG